MEKVKYHTSLRIDSKLKKLRSELHASHLRRGLLGANPNNQSKTFECTYHHLPFLTRYRTACRHAFHEAIVSSLDFRH